MRSIRSFFGILNYYDNFTENSAIYTSVLYELREIELFEIIQLDVGDTTSIKPIKEDHDPDMKERRGSDPNERTRCENAAIAFTMLKAKIATIPILKHFDPDRIPVIVVFAS